MEVSRVGKVVQLTGLSKPEYDMISFALKDNPFYVIFHDEDSIKFIWAYIKIARRLERMLGNKTKMSQVEDVINERLNGDLLWRREVLRA